MLCLGGWGRRRFLLDAVHWWLRSGLLRRGSSLLLLLLLLRYYLYLSNLFLLNKATSNHDAPRKSQWGLREVRDFPMRSLRDVRNLLFGRGFRLRFLCLLGFWCWLFIVKRHFFVWHLLLLLLWSLGLATLALVVLLFGLLVVLFLIIVFILASLLIGCLPLLIGDVSCLNRGHVRMLLTIWVVRGALY